MLLITIEDRDRILSNLDAMRAAQRSMARILPDEILAANTVAAGIADAMIILSNLRSASDVIQEMVETVFVDRCRHEAAGYTQS